MYMDMYMCMYTNMRYSASVCELRPSLIPPFYLDVWAYTLTLDLARGLFAELFGSPSLSGGPNRNIPPIPGGSSLKRE